MIETWTVGKKTVELEDATLDDAADLTDTAVLLAEVENADAELVELAVLSNSTVPVMLGAPMVKLNVAFAVRAVGVPESVIWKVRDVAGVAEVAPAAAEITPVVAFRVTPVGSVPLASVHIYGAMPPDPTNVAEAAAPGMNKGSEPVRIVGAAGIVTVTKPDLVESATEVAVKVTVCREWVAPGAV